MSKQTASEVPQIRFKGFDGEWNKTTFQTACSLLTGHPFQSKQFTKSGFFLVRGMNVKRGYVDDSKQISEFWPSSSGLEAFLLKEGDIVIQMDGALIGRSYAKIRQENLPALLVQRVTRARCESTSNSEYIYQYIERDFLKYIRATKTETAVPHLSLNDIRQFPISTSTPPEQTRIGEYFRELDSLIGLHQRKHDKLVTLKKAMLQKMFPQPGTTTPEIRFKGFSGDWMEKRLGDVATFLNGRAYSQNELLNKGLHRVLRVGNFYTNSSWYYSDMNLAEKFYANKGDLLYTWSASFGPHIWEGEKVIYHYHIWKVELSEALQKAFALQLLENDKKRILDNSNGSTMVHITKVGMEGKSIVIPHPEEQQKIGLYFRTLDSLISKHATQLQKLQQIKSACLEKMFV